MNCQRTDSSPVTTLVLWSQLYLYPELIMLHLPNHLCSFCHCLQTFLVWMMDPLPTPMLFFLLPFALSISANKSLEKHFPRIDPYSLISLSDCSDCLAMDPVSPPWPSSTLTSDDNILNWSGSPIGGTQTEISVSSPLKRPSGTLPCLFKYKAALFSEWRGFGCCCVFFLGF